MRPEGSLKVICMRLLIIGILSTLLSCTSQTDGSIYEEYKYMN